MPLPTTQDTTIEPTTLVDAAFRRVRELIVTGALAPGEQIREGDLARWLGISRTPVREVIDRLQDVGLVRDVPHRGTWVTELDPAELRHTTMAMAALMGTAAQLAWRRLTPEDLTQIRRAMADGGAMAGDVDNSERRATLHALLNPFVARQDNPVITQLIDQLRPRLLRVVNLAPVTHIPMQDLARACGRLERAMTADDEMQVGWAIGRLYIELLDHLIRSLEDVPGVRSEEDPLPATPGPRSGRGGPTRPRPTDPYTRRMRLVAGVG